MSDIEKILDFMVEVEKLKCVLRKSRPVGSGRYENSAEHSWHVCLSALMLKDFADEKIDINRVVRMLLVHDLGESGFERLMVRSAWRVRMRIPLGVCASAQYFELQPMSILFPNFPVALLKKWAISGHVKRDLNSNFIFAV